MPRPNLITQVGTSLRAHAAALRYGQPSKKVQVILVMGQDGSVGTVAFLASILRAAGSRVAVVTRQYVEIGDERVEGSDRADINGDTFRLQGLLAHIKRAKCQFAILEVPQELPAHQFAGLKPAMVVVRRCGDDFIDQATVAARLSMLQSVLALQPDYVVYNKDDPCNVQIAQYVGHDGVISFGTRAKAECRVTDVALRPSGSEISLMIDHQIKVSLDTTLVGRQTVYNATAAAAAAYILRVPIDAIETGVHNLPAQPAQCEYLAINRPFQVVLDTAASPAALAETLETLKHFAKNRLIVVLSVPLGLPPAWLRYLGEISSKYADRIIVCDGEYSVHQLPGVVREQLLQGAALFGGEAKTEEIADRRSALEKAIGIARRGDVVVVAAVTQHAYRQLGEKRVRWSDRDVVSKIVGS